MRTSIANLIIACLGVAAASPFATDSDIPVFTEAELDARDIDVPACFLTMYTGASCTGNVGNRNFGPGACATFEGPPRVAYTISSACPTITVNFFSAGQCSGTQQSVSQGPGCYNINTGFQVGSIRATA